MDPSGFIALDKCPLCSGGDIELLFEAKSGMHSRHVICQNCTLVYQNPQPSDQLLQQYYLRNYKDVLNRSGSSNGDPTVSALRNAAIKARRVTSFLRPYVNPSFHKSALDVGASAGVLLDALKAEGFETCGVEPNESFARFARQNGHRIEIGPFASGTFSGQRFDLVTMSHVLEHLISPLDVLQALKERISLPHGFLAIEVPNLLKPNGLLDGFFQFPHLFTFSPLSLKLLLSKAGYSILAWNNDFPHLRMIARPASTIPLSGGPFPDRGLDGQRDLRRIRRRLRNFDRLYRYCGILIRVRRRIGLVPKA